MRTFNLAVGMLLSVRTVHSRMALAPFLVETPDTPDECTAIFQIDTATIQQLLYSSNPTGWIGTIISGRMGTTVDTPDILQWCTLYRALSRTGTVQHSDADR